jgi:hypothetical protein
VPKRTLLSYLPVSPLVRLKSPALIERWERLAAYAQAVPDRPQSVVYMNALVTDWELTAHREKLNSSMVFFAKHAYEDAEALADLDPGQAIHVVHTEYKVNTKTPFIVRHIQSTHLQATTGGGLDLASKDRLGVRGMYRLLRMSSTTGALTPSEDEVDEILNYLDHATPAVHDTFED